MLSFRQPLLLLLCAELIALVLCAREFLLLPDRRTHVTFMDVGQGDAAMITTPSGKRVIIDGGRDNSLLRLLGKRIPLLDRRIDLLIASHPQLDHIAAFPEILRRYQVKRVLMTGVRYELPQYRDMLEEIRLQKIPVWIADPRQDIDFGDGTVLDIAWPPPTLLGKEMKDVNNSSIVLRVLTQSGSALFVGDAELKEENAVLASGAPLAATALKVGHHGSKTSSGTGFLLAVRPSLAVASFAKKNSYGHPHGSVMERFKALGIPLRATGWEGTIDVMY